MFRKLIVAVVTVAFVFALTGCNLKEKIGESITEGLLEKAAGDDVDINLDGDEFTISGEDGEYTFNEEEGVTFEGEDGSVVASGGDFEWPKDLSAQYLPKFDSGKISYIVNSEETCMIGIEEIVIEDYEDYVEEVKDDGYNNEVVESNAPEMSLYQGKAENGVVVAVCYFENDGERSIQISVDATQKQ